MSQSRQNKKTIATPYTRQNMIDIAVWGKLFATDAAGFIINDCHPDKISPPWTPLVSEFNQACQNVWLTRLAGVYLRGSVPRGLAIPYISDLDSFAILSGDITPQDLDQARHITQRLNKRYLFCKKVELILLNKTIIQASKSVWPGIIQTRSLKISGDYTSENLPQFKPGRSLVNYAKIWEQDRIKILDSLIDIDPSHLKFSAQVKQKCGWIMRRMVRTGFELVMERDRSYTPDLYYCYERFSTYFPEQRAKMKKALELAIVPSANRPGLIVFLRSFGCWLTAQVKAELS